MCVFDVGCRESATTRLHKWIIAVEGIVGDDRPRHMGRTSGDVDRRRSGDRDEGQSESKEVERKLHCRVEKWRRKKKYAGPRTGTRETSRYIDRQERRADKKKKFRNTSEGYDRR